MEWPLPCVRAQRHGGRECGLIPHLAFDEGALGVFATVAIRIPCGVDSLEADARGWFSTWNRRTMAPSLSLLLISSEQHWALGLRGGVFHVWRSGTQYPDGSGVGCCQPGGPTAGILSWPSPLIFLCCAVDYNLGPKACADSQEIRLDCVIGSGQKQEGAGWLAGCRQGEATLRSNIPHNSGEKRQARQASRSSDGLCVWEGMRGGRVRGMQKSFVFSPRELQE